MTALRRYHAGWRRRWLSLLLSQALTLHLLSPAVAGLPEKDGYVPICTGSEVVYLPLAALGLPAPADDVPEPLSELCPWCAPFHAIAFLPVTAMQTAVVYRVVHVRPADTTAEGQQTLPSFQARAPPPRGA